MASSLVFDLIKSLDRNEKGYFKKQARQHDKKQSQNYLHLFDAIDKQQIYDESRLRKEFAGYSKTASFSRAKGYLLEAVLKSLIVYHQGNYVRDNVQMLIQSATALFDKGFDLEAKNYLTKAKALAYKIEDFTSIISILKFEKATLTRHFNEHFPEAMDSLLAEGQACLRHIDKLTQLHRIYYRLFYFIKKRRFINTTAERQEIEELIQNPILQTIDSQSPVNGRITYHSIYLFYYDLKGDYEKGFEQSQIILNIWKENPDLLYENLTKYLAAIQNFMNECWRMNRHDDILPLLDDLNRLKPSDIGMKTRIFETYHLCNILYHAVSLKIYDYLPQIGPFLKEFDKVKNKIKPSYQWQFLYNIICMCLFIARWDKALEIINRLIKSNHYEQFTGMKRVIPIITLIVHYELGNTESLPYYIKSTERLFKKNGYGELELSFLRFMSNLNASAPSERKALFAVYLDETRLMEAEAADEPTILKIFDWKAWLNSAIKGKTILEIVKENDF